MEIELLARKILKYIFCGKGRLKSILIMNSIRIKEKKALKKEPTI